MWPQPRRFAFLHPACLTECRTPRHGALEWGACAGIYNAETSAIPQYQYPIHLIPAVRTVALRH